MAFTLIQPPSLSSRRLIKKRSGNPQIIEPPPGILNVVNSAIVVPSTINTARVMHNSQPLLQAIAVTTPTIKKASDITIALAGGITKRIATIATLKSNNPTLPLIVDNALTTNTTRVVTPNIIRNVSPQNPHELCKGNNSIRVDSPSINPRLRFAKLVDAHHISTPSVVSPTVVNQVKPLSTGPDDIRGATTPSAPEITLNTPTIRPPNTVMKLTNADFLLHCDIDEDNQVQPKSDYLKIKGSGHVIGKHCTHLYVNGFNNHVVNGIAYSSVEGSHSLVVNSGSSVSSVPFEIDGLKKIGKAQSETLQLTAVVNDRGITHFTNPMERDRPMATTIRLPLSHCTALVKISFVVRGKNNILATGTATNTVTINSTGGSEWARSDFTVTYDHTTLPASLSISGVNMNRFSNSTAIEISNGEGNGELQIFAEVYLLCLAD